MKISVLQWNVWYKENTENIARFLVEQDADIICLQELTIDNPDQDIQNAPEYLGKELGYNYFYKAIPFDNITAKQANGVFSRYPITKTRYVWINEPTGTGKYDDEYRALVEVEIEICGRLMTIATVHMSYTHGFEITQRKIIETDALTSILATHEKNFILTGDLNARPDSYTIQEVERHLDLASPEYEIPTWTTKPFSYDGFEADELKWRLDYIFATKDLTVASTSIVKTSLSDHLPILTKFELE